MSLFDKFKIGLGKSSSGLSGGFKNIFSKKKLDNTVLDEFEELIQQFDSYGAFRRLAAKRLGIPVIRVTIQEINEVTKQVHQAYADFPNRRRKL